MIKENVLFKMRKYEKLMLQSRERFYHYLPQTNATLLIFGHARFNDTLSLVIFCACFGTSASTSVPIAFTYIGMHFRKSGEIEKVF